MTRPVSSEEYDTIVYDLDGTLVELAVDWEAARRDVANVLRARNLQIEDSMDLWNLLDVAATDGYSETVETKLAAHEREGAWSARRLPLADELPHDVPVGVCSLNCEDACRIALERHGLERHVDAIVGRDTEPARKPEPAPLLAVIEALDGSPADSLFVGDSETDAIAAERAGVDFRWVRERREME